MKPAFHRTLVTLLAVWLSVLGSGRATPDASAATIGHRESAEAPAAGASRPSTGFELPIAGPADVLTPFRPPVTSYGRGHRGVDLAAPVGTAVHAASGGLVIYAGSLAGRGVISIEHPSGLRTTYEPVTAGVALGQRVTAGQVVGVLQPGHASCAPASCLHWGARLPDGSYLDPMSLLTGLRVRLLPWVGS